MATNISLKQQIDSFKSRFAQNTPIEVITALVKHIDTLAGSGLADNALKPGQKAPDFVLPNPSGKEIGLSQLLQDGPVVVVFYRGAWCPFCNLTLRAYQQILPEIKKLGATLIAISPQNADHSLSMAAKHALDFHVLTDLGNVVARQYGIVFSMEEEMRALNARLGTPLPFFNSDNSWELPVPAVFIIDQNCVVQMAYADANFTHRLEPADLLEGLMALDTNFMHLRPPKDDKSVCESVLAKNERATI